jgi:hypothetical protein
MKTEPNDSVNINKLGFPTKEGLTKREYFAALAMQGLCSQNENTKPTAGHYKLAKASVLMADTLISALNGEGL